MRTNNPTFNLNSFTGKSWRSFAWLLATLLTLVGANSFASTKTWTGGGADANWGTTLNWDAGIPVNGDDLVFDGSTRTTNANNIAVGLGLNSITYNNFLFQLAGNSVVITNGVTDNIGFNTNNLPLVLGASQSFTENGGSSPLQFGGTIALNGFNLSGVGPGNIYLNGIISGNGNINMNGDGSGNGILRLSGVNTFAGNVMVNNGTLQFGNAGGVPSGPGRGDVTNNGVLDLNGISPAINNLYGNGTVDNRTGTATYTLSVGNNPTNQGGVFQFDGTIQNSSGSVALSKVNTNVMTLTANSGYSGATTINAGSLILGASASISGSTLVNVLPSAIFDVSAFGGSGYNIPGAQTIQAGRVSGFNGDIFGSLNVVGKINVYNPGQAGTMTITNGSLSLTAATLYFDLSTNTATGGGTNDLINVTGNLNLAAVNNFVLNPMLGSYGVGTYTLITAATIASGGVGNLAGNALPRGVTATFGTTTTPGKVTVTVSGSAAPASLVWSGINGANWDVQITQSWLNSAVPDFFYTFDNVVFNDTTVNSTLNVAQAVTPNSVTFNNSLSNYVFNGSSAISGSGSLTENATGTVTLNNPNGYTGDTIFNYGNLVLGSYGVSPNTVIYNGVPWGRVVLGNAGIFASDAANITFSNSFNLALNPGGSSVAMRNRQSSSSYIIQIGNITRAIGGTVDFNNIQQKAASPQVGLLITNTTTVNGIWAPFATIFQNDWITPVATGLGSIAYAGYQAQANPALWGALSNVVLTANPSAAVTTESINSLKLTGPAAVSITAGQTLTLSSGGLLVPANAAGASSISGGTLLGAPNADLIVLQNSANALTISSTIANNGTVSSLTKAGSGTLILTGANSYGGTTYVNGPTLTGSAGAGFGVTAPGLLQVGAGSTTGDLGSTTNAVVNGNLFFNRSDVVTAHFPVSGIGGFGSIGAGTLIITNNARHSGLTTNRLGTLQIGNGGTLGSVSNSSVIMNSGTLAVNRSDTVGFPRIIGTGSFVQQGSGNVVLNAANTYLGSTFVNAGTLTLGASGTVANTVGIIVAGGATFDASGSAAGGIVLNSAGSGQTIFGTGTVKGNVTATNNTFLSPATNGVIGNLTLNNDLNLIGGSLLMDLSSTSSHDLLTVNGNLTLTSGSVVVNPLNFLADGSYKIIAYSGSLSGSAANISVSGLIGKVGVLSSSTAGEIDLVVSTIVGRNLVWQGDGVANVWDLTALNWLNGATAVAFSNFDNGTLTDAGSLSPAININANISAGTVTVKAAGTYTFGGTGKLTGGTSLVKTNSGTLVIVNANDFNNVLAINQGTVQVGDGVTTGSAISSAPISITNGASLVFNKPDTGTAAGIISGQGQLIKQGAGTLQLTGNSTLSGPTTISAGILQIGTGGNSGSLGSGPVTNNTALNFNRNGTVTQNGSITGSGVVSNLNGTVVLAAANTYAGSTVIAGGVAQMGVAGALPATTTVVLNGGASSGVLDLHGFDQTVSGLTGAAGASPGVVMNNSGLATNVLTVNSAVTNVFAGQLADNSGGGGKLALVVTGPGTENLDINSVVGNIYSGGTVISNGAVLSLTSPPVTGTTPLYPAANSVALGSGPVTFYNGTLSVVGSFGKNNGPTFFPGVGNTMIVPAGQVGIVYGPQRGEFSPSAVLGSGTFHYIAAYVRGTIGGNWSGFTGQTIIEGSSNGGNVGITTASGFGLLRCTNFVTMYNTAAGTPTIPIGELSDDGSTVLAAATSGGGGGLVATFAVGGANTSTNYGGSIIDNLNITKVGTGSWTLTSASLTYTGTTTVSNGVLALGPVATLPNSGTITLAAPGKLDVSAAGALNLGSATVQTLQGDGTLNGTLTVAGASTILPGGANGIGRLTVTNAVNLHALGTVVMELNETNAVGTNDQISAASINYLGTLTVTNIGPALHAGDSFKLFAAPTLAGTFGVTNLPVTDNNGYTYTWTNKLAIDGTIKVLTAIASVNTNAFTMTNSYDSGAHTLTLSWPVDHKGYRLQSQTNSIAAGIQTNWVDIAGGNLTNVMIFPVVSTNGSVFYRLIYP